MPNKTSSIEWLRIVYQTKDEIKEVLEFTENLFEDVCKILEIDMDEIVRDG